MSAINRRQLIQTGTTLAVAAPPVISPTSSDTPTRSTVFERSAQEIAAGVSPLDTSHPEGYVERYGADRLGVRDSGPAFNLAYRVSCAFGNTVGVAIRAHGGRYRVTTPIVFDSETTGYLALICDGPGTKIVNDVTGNGANPCILVRAKAPYFTLQGFDIHGNGLTGSSGNGHGIAFVNPDPPGTAGVRSFYPQSITLRDVIVQNCKGTGQAYNGTSIPSCGIYAYGTTVINLDSIFLYNNACGFRSYLGSKVHFNQTTIDACTSNGLYLEGCQDVTFVNGTLNGCGSGGATDGLIHAVSNTLLSQSIRVSYSRLKNGNPHIANLSSGTASYGSHFSIEHCDVRQLEDDSSHAMTLCRIGNGWQNFSFNNNYVLVLNTFTDAVGIDVVQTTSGITSSGLEISGNKWDCGNGGRYAACIRLNLTSNRVVSPKISGNTFAGGMWSATDVIRVAGNVDSAFIIRNFFQPGPGTTFTNCITLTNAQVRYAILSQNDFSTTFGTITNEVVDNGLGTMRVERGVTDVARVGSLMLKDGITAPSAVAGCTSIFVDAVDGILKIRYGDGTMKTIVVDG